MKRPMNTHIQKLAAEEASMKQNYENQIAGLSASFEAQLKADRERMEKIVSDQLAAKEKEEGNSGIRCQD